MLSEKLFGRQDFTVMIKNLVIYKIPKGNFLFAYFCEKQGKFEKE